MSFVLDPRLENSSVFIADLELSHVRLSKNAAFPWILLMPRQNNLVEIFDLSIPDQETLLKEIRHGAAIMKKLYAPKKLNVANIGNITPQLHVHIVARYDTDKAWPNPIWGSDAKEEYTAEKLAAAVAALKKEFAA